MSSKEIATSHGFAYAMDCKICKSKYEIWLNPSLPKIEMKIKKGKDYVKIYKSGQQIAYCNQHTLEGVLNSLFGVTV